MRYKVDIAEIKAIMGRKGYNISKLAEKMGVSRETVSSLLKGTNPSYPVMCKTIDALCIDGVTAQQIFFAPDLRNT